jgi:hypothetical protein
MHAHGANVRLSRRTFVGGVAGLPTYLVMAPSLHVVEPPYVV